MDAVEHLAGGVAHELNNILLVVRGYVELALEESDLGVAARSHLLEVTSALSRASEVLGQLLAVGRRPQSPLAEVDLNDLVGRIAQQGRFAHRTGVQVSLVAGAGLPGLQAPREDIERCVRGLIAFAVERMPDGGTVSVETLLDGSPGRIVFRLGAPGALVADDELAHFFEPFYESPKTGRRLGLALAAARGTVSLAGGEMLVRGLSSGGFELTAVFPARGEATGTAATDGGGTALLAEDDAGLRELASRILAKEGYRVLAAADGDEALRIFELNRDTISVAILDDVMPKRSGRDVLARIRVKRPSLPVILCTGYAWGVQEPRSAPAVQEILGKPYDARELLRSVRRVTDDRR